MTRKQFLELKKQVKEFQNGINESEGRISICCSVKKDKFSIKRDWTDRMLNGEGMCVTSLTKESPTDNVTSRIATGLGI